MDKSIQKTTLYRYFDNEGRLLYVGITGDNTKRQSQHRRNSFWFGEIASATFEHYESRQEACACEIRAIQEEHPLYNTQHLNSKKQEFNPAELVAKYHLLSMLSGFDINKNPIPIDRDHIEFKKSIDLFDLKNNDFSMDELIVMQLEDLVWRETLGEVELLNLDTCELCLSLFHSNWYGETLRLMDARIEKSRREFVNATN